MNRLKSYVLRKLDKWATKDCYKMIKWCDGRLAYHQGEIRWLAEARDKYIEMLGNERNEK